MPLRRSPIVAVFVALALCGCDAGTAATKPTTAPATMAPTMNFTVEHVFYIKPPVDRVILVGMINEGTVRVGDKLVVHTSAGPVNVAVDNIESIQQGDLKQATKGHQVGLRLTGIHKDQASAGDRVTAVGGA
jgi:translation elongation factor EF-1alpha